LPRGGARLLRWEAVRKIGGYPSTPSHETVMDFRVQRCGWRVKRLRNVNAYQCRPTFGAQSVRESLTSHGRGRYQLRMGPLTAFATGAIVAKHRGLQAGWWFAYGYAASMVTKGWRVEDRDVEEMFPSP